MSWLSPVSWAKWTWTAVRGGEGQEQDEEGLEASEEGEQRGERGEEEEEERSQGCRQVSCWSPESLIHTVQWGKEGILT